MTALSSSPNGTDAFELTWDAAVTMTHTLRNEIGMSASSAADLIRSVEGISAAPGVYPQLDEARINDDSQVTGA